ncbi:MAG TPA: hypothetical protein VM889_08530 [Candidatus Thermoplasmatota archaeon]|nr:hypothetical protein [Candidatus Thermoplasmatota archaeon]
MRVSVSLITVLLLAAGAASGAGYFVDTSYEIDEPGRSTRLAAMGQRNCIAEAVNARGGPDCPVQPIVTGFKPNPTSGIRVLDSHYTTQSGLPTPGLLVGNLGETVDDVDDAVAAGRGPTQPGTSQGGNNLRRDSGGLLPDVILPGQGQLRAWYGHWNDLNGNGVIEAWRGTGAAAQSNDEWFSKTLGKLAAYVDPGSHPHVRNLDRPGDSSPDFWYVPYAGSNYEWYQTGLNNDNYILFVDGSLMRTLTVRSVTEPILSPNADGSAPYTTSPTSLVDIDEYPALAPTPVASAYAATVGNLVWPLGSPSLGTCPNGCRPGPFSLRGTPIQGLEPLLAPHVRNLYAPYPREHAPGEGSTSAGRHADHLAAYRGWIDLIPTWGYRNVSHQEASYYARGGPLPGKTADGRQAMMPGFLSFEVRTGIWKDLDGDGYIGTAGPDPYHSGFRPLPDNYTDPRGEFFGIFADKGSYASHVSFRIVLVPDTTWGPGVIVVDDFTGSPGGNDVVCTGRSATVPNCVKDPTRYGAYTGTQPIVLNARRDVTEAGVGSDSVPGLYRSNAAFFPQGSEGFAFTACTELLTLKYVENDGPVEETLRDCDWIGPLASRT